MAAIARRSFLTLAAMVLKGADEPDIALEVINRLTTALSGGDAAGAIETFDRACPEYEKLASYFAALTNAYAITNEAQVSDEQRSATEANLTLDWTLTLQSLASDASTRRQRQVTARVSQRSRRITRFTPVELFNPG